MRDAYRFRIPGDARMPYLVCKVAARRGGARDCNGRRYRLGTRHQRLARRYWRREHGRAPGAFGHGSFSGLFHPLHQFVPHAF